MMGSLISDDLFCASFSASKHGDSEFTVTVRWGRSYWSPVALILLCLRGSFCKWVHLATATPSSLATDFAAFDSHVRQCFKDCFGVWLLWFYIATGSARSMLWLLWPAHSFSPYTFNLYCFCVLLRFWGQESLVSCLHFSPQFPSISCHFCTHISVLSHLAENFV